MRNNPKILFIFCFWISLSFHTFLWEVSPVEDQPNPHINPLNKIKIQLTKTKKNQKRNPIESETIKQKPTPQSNASKQLLDSRNHSKQKKLSLGTSYRELFPNKDNFLNREQGKSGINTEKSNKISFKSISNLTKLKSIMENHFKLPDEIYTLAPFGFSSALIIVDETKGIYYKNLVGNSYLCGFFYLEVQKLFKDKRTKNILWNIGNFNIEIMMVEGRKSKREVQISDNKLIIKYFYKPSNSRLNLVRVTENSRFDKEISVDLLGPIFSAYNYYNREKLPGDYQNKKIRDITESEAFYQKIEYRMLLEAKHLRLEKSPVSQELKSSL